MPLHENLRFLRLRSKLGQADVAAELEVSIPTISEWERGRKAPSRKNLFKLASFYNVPADLLLARSEREIADYLKHMPAGRGPRNLVDLMESLDKNRAVYERLNPDAKNFLDRMDLVEAYTALIGLWKLYESFASRSIGHLKLAGEIIGDDPDPRSQEFSKSLIDTAKSGEKTLNDARATLGDYVIKAKTSTGGWDLGIGVPINFFSLSREELAKLIGTGSDTKGVEEIEGLFEFVKKRRSTREN